MVEITAEEQNTVKRMKRTEASLIALWLEKMPDTISVFLNLLRFDL